MRNLRIYISILLSCLLLDSCTDIYEYGYGRYLTASTTVHYLRPSDNQFGTVSYKEYTKVFTVQSLNTSWQFSDTPDWMSLSPKSGNSNVTNTSVRLSAEENKSAISARSAIFSLSSTTPEWKFSRSLYLTQGSAPASLSVEDSNLVFGGAAEAKDVCITANCIWECKSSYSWITASCDLDKGILNISVSANSSYSYRNGTIYVVYDNKSVPITIRQAPAGITSSAAQLEYENVASSYQVKIDAEADWNAVVSDSWIKVTPDKGQAGQTEIAIEVSPNTKVAARYGYVSFYMGSYAKIQIEIIQNGLYIKSSEAQLHYPASGQKKTLHIQSNTEWQVLRSPNWLSLSATQGSRNAEITVTASDNPNSTKREGEIVFGQQGLDIECAIQVIQDAKTLTSSSYQLDFTDKGGVDSVRIASNSSWTSVLSDSWFGASPQNGTGDTTIEVSVNENLSDTERTGTIRYLYADNFADVLIHQLAKYLTIDNKSFDFSCTGGTHSIYLSSNDKWTAEIENSVDWLKFSSTSGDGSATIVLTADKNPTINVRSTVVNITSSHAQSFRILVSQQPQTLSVNTQKLFFFSDGGTSEVVKVTTQGRYSLTSTTDWLAIRQNSNNTFTVVANRNETKESRNGKIIISLQDLVDCSYSIELPVVQAGEGGSFVKEAYGEDKNWDFVNSGDIYLTITRYIADQNWNTPEGGSFTVKVTGYTTEYDWNKSDKSNGRVTITHYGNDSNWGPGSDASVDIDKGQHGQDSNWDQDSSSSGGIGLDKHGNDKEWNPGNDGSGYIGRKEYNDDNNWN